MRAPANHNDQQQLAVVPTHSPSTVVGIPLNNNSSQFDRGRGQERPAHPNPATHRITLSTGDIGRGHTPDDFTGIKAFLPQTDFVTAQYRVQEGWGDQLTNDSRRRSLTVVPWDHGISAAVRPNSEEFVL